MKRIVSFFGEDSELFRELNKKAEEYAGSLGVEYKWALQNPYSREDVIRELQQADAGIIDVEPYGRGYFQSGEGQREAAGTLRRGLR